MKLRILAAGIAALVLSGCTNSVISPTPAPAPAPVVKRTTYDQASVEKQERFQKDMIAVATSTKDDPNYHRMALDTPQKKAWFRNLMYQLWDGQLTKQQFVAEGLRAYPDHKYEFEFIADGYAKRK